MPLPTVRERDNPAAVVDVNHAFVEVTIPDRTIAWGNRIEQLLRHAFQLRFDPSRTLAARPAREYQQRASDQH